MASTIARFTDVSRRSIVNGFKNPGNISDKTRQKIRDDLKSRVPEQYGIPPDQMQAVDLLFSPEDDTNTGTLHYWSDMLESTEHGYLLPYREKGKISPEIRILPSQSIEELRIMEEVHCSIAELFRQHRYREAASLLVDSKQQIPLLRSYKLTEDDVDRLADPKTLRPCCIKIQLKSAMYMLALVDLSLGHGGDIDSAESGFQNLLPSWQDNKWHYPIRAWLDGVNKELGGDSFNTLGKIYAGWKAQMDDEHGIREVMRWRNEDITPLWETARLFCGKLGPEYSDIWIKHFLRYVAARILQEFHKQLVNKVATDDLLATIYAEYPHWYQHHKHINTKTPA